MSPRPRLSPPEALFLAAGLVAGMVYLLVFPPLSVADEPGHFYRAFAVSGFDALPHRRGPAIGAELPLSLTTLVPELGVGEALLAHPEHRVDPERLRAAWRRPLEPRRRGFVEFPGPAQYPFVVYLPQALGIAGGRLFGAGPLLLVYLARLSNLLISTAITGLALRLTPVGRWPLAALALTPMAVSSRASASADALTTALAFLALAAVAALAWGPEGRRGWRLLVGAGVGLALTKLPYALLLGSLAVVPRERLELPRRWRSRSFAALVLLAALAFAAWQAASFGGHARPEAGLAFDRQVRDTLAEPLRFARLVAGHYLEHADRYVAQLVGIQLGWLDVRLPTGLIWGYLLAVLALLLWTGEADIGVAAWQRCLLAAMVVVLAVAIAASQYATWTPYRAPAIEGPQGRYFLPAAPLVVFALHRRGRLPGAGWRLAVGLAALYAAATAIAALCILRRHYG
jgi:uncharacterized membrane protein